jgi:Kef-type K+ transport system membrane component KefB
VAAPLLVDRLERWVRLPSVVVEIVLGIVIGPQVLGLVQEHLLFATVTQLGLAMLFFLAGYEIDVRAVRGRPITLASLGWVLSFVLAAGGLFVAGAGAAVLILASGLCSTALGDDVADRAGVGVVGGAGGAVSDGGGGGG